MGKRAKNHADMYSTRAVVVSRMAGAPKEKPFPETIHSDDGTGILQKVLYGTYKNT